jgi:regulator of protease activity HflC (stomatin/prohibitin superfamily)
MIREREYGAVSGWGALVVLLAGAAFFIWQVIVRARQIQEANQPLLMVLSIVGVVVCVFLLLGLFVVNPNEGKVLQLFGKYVGTVKAPGLRFANPLYAKKKVSLRVRNFESAKLKVNDLDGNPIEIAAVVVWKVVDTAEAVFEVDNFENYIHVQSEAAIRNMATSYPYDAHEDTHMSLRGNTAAIADHLRTEIQDRLSRAGVEVVEARISHLAYAPEIAAAMLQRQQAGADHRGAPEDRRGRGGDGRNGPRTALREKRGASGRRAQGRDGEQSPGRALRRSQHTADRQRRHAPSLRIEWPSARHFSSASTRRSSTPSSTGPTMSCGA